MGIQRRYWLYFLQDAPSGLCYYIDSMGNVQKGNVMLGDDLSLPQSPGGWDEIQLSFGRSAHYWGINRTFTIPLKFIGDGAKIIRHLFYTSKGIESPVNLVICKWDDVTGVFRLYYSGQLDLTKIEDEVAEGVKINIMQGGIIQALKAYENTIFEIPCDGSIPENIKVNCDGILLNDVFHYQILNVTVPYPGVLPLPCAFLNNDGDNIGITRNNPVLEQPYAGYQQKSTNFLFSSLEPISVRIQGTITIIPDWRISNTYFYMYLSTSLGQPYGVDGIDHSVGLITPQNNAGEVFYGSKSQINVVGQKEFYFDAVINLIANENLFLFFFNNFSAYPITIIGGAFSLTFSSRYKASRVWGIRPYDLGKLIIQQMNALSSNFIQTFNYLFDSMLLQNNPNLIITSGDALRASTDPNYFQYYNQATVNPANPNNQFYNQFASLGPVIKTSISDFFDSFNAILNAALSNQTLPGEAESLFIESKSYVMDPSVITMTLTKIANFRVSIALEYFFNWIKVGYTPQQYDEKAGKYEYNTLVQWQAPIKTVAKILELMCKYRADSYGIEYTRYNTQGGKSSTFNDSDNSVFLLNTDLSVSEPDFYNAYFISGVPLPTSPTNTDQKLTPNQSYLPVYLDTLDGEYFTALNDFSIFMFNQPAPGTQSISVSTPTPALLNGLIGDSATINMYINGILIQSWTQAVTGVNTPFNISYTSSRAFVKGDNIYFTVSTVRTCTVEITDFIISIGSGYWSAETSGPINISAGSSQQTISLPNIIATMITIGGIQIPVVSSGFQYFTFLSNVHNKNFNWSFGVSVYHDGSPGETVEFDVWQNGINIGTLSFNGNSVLTWFNPPIIIDGLSLPPVNFSGNITFNLYDIIWITGSDTNINTYITNCQLLFDSTGVDAFDLLRLAYSNVSGIPNPQTAFNIEQLTPKRILQSNSNLLSPVLFNQAPGSLKFQTADKNQFVSTTLGGVTITENANVDIHDMNAPLFYPLIFEFDTEVPINFADLFNTAANGHIEFIYNGVSFYGFPIQVTAKPAFNESQTWKLLCSPKTNLSDLVNLDWTGLQQLMPLDISIPIISPVHFVPLGFIKADYYKNNTMDQDLYRNRIQAWIDTSDYTAPRQNDEPIPFQCQSGSLSPCSVQVLNNLGQDVGSPINIPSITDPAINVPQLLFQGLIPVNTLSDGIYYFLLSVGTGPATGQFISEGIYIKADWDYNTIRFDYSNTTNKLAAIFTSNPGFNIRVHGQINRYTPKSKFTTFIDQPQDIDLLNAIPYDTWRLEIGRSSGIPDYMMRKIARIFDLDTVLIDGDQYTRDGEAQWEKQNFPGQPKEYLSLDIRRAKNIDAITLNTSGQLTSDMEGGYTLDPQAFGAGPTQPLIEVNGS